MSSHEEINSTRASENQQEPPDEGSCTITRVAENVVRFEGENLRPRSCETPTDWMIRTRDNRQSVYADRESERREGDPERAQANWLIRWGFKSSEEANGVLNSAIFERHAALERHNKKRTAEALEETAENFTQPPSKKRKTVRFVEEPEMRSASSRDESEDSHEHSSTENHDSVREDESEDDHEQLSTKYQDSDREDDIRKRREAIVRQQRQNKKEKEGAKKWLVIKAYQTSPLERDPRKVTLKQMREDNPSMQTFSSRWWARKKFRDDARDPPLTPKEKLWAVRVPSYLGEEEDDEDVFDLRRETDSPTDFLSGDEPYGRVISQGWGSETEEAANRSEKAEGGPSQSPSSKGKGVEVVEQPRMRLTSSLDKSEDRAAEETRAKRWLAQKALTISPLNPDPTLVTMEHMREGNASPGRVQTRWCMQKMMKDETRDPQLTEKEQNDAMLGTILDPPREDPIRSLPDIPAEEGASEPLVQRQNVPKKRPASFMDESESSSSHSAVKRPRIKRLQRERPVGWLLDSLGGARRARRWLAEKAARTSPQDIELTHKNTRTLSMEQMRGDSPDEVTLWTRWATQKVMEDEIEDTAREQPGTAREESSAIMAPGHPRDSNDTPPAEPSFNRDIGTDGVRDSEPVVPTVSPDLDTRAAPTPESDLLQAIMNRLEALEKVVREAFVGKAQAEPASQQASSTVPTKKRGRGWPKKSDFAAQISVDEQLDLAATQNIAKGKASDEPEPTTLPTQEQEPRRKPGRSRKDAHPTARKTGSTSKSTTKSAAPPVTPASHSETQCGRGRPREEELPVTGEASTKTIGKQTSTARKPTTATASSTHKMRTRTQASGGQ